MKLLHIYTHKGASMKQWILPRPKEKRQHSKSYAVFFGRSVGIRLHRRPGMDDDYGFAPSSRREQQSTGLLHLDSSNPLLQT